jgi:hypothetical protein
MDRSSTRSRPGIGQGHCGQEIATGRRRATAPDKNTARRLQCPEVLIARLDELTSCFPLLLQRMVHDARLQQCYGRAVH